MLGNEKIPFVIRVLMCVGFQVILLFGVLNALIFNPKSAAKNYKVCKLVFYCLLSFTTLDYHTFFIQKFKGLFDKFEEVYFNYVYRRVSDCSHSPISSILGSKVFLIDRKTEDYGWTFKLVHSVIQHDVPYFILPSLFHFF